MNDEMKKGLEYAKGSNALEGQVLTPEENELVVEALINNQSEEELIEKIMILTKKKENLEEQNENRVRW